MSIDVRELRERFCKLYGPGPVAVSFGPGRVNVIGEHTDYNGGLVLPFAIDRGVAAAFRAVEGNVVRVHSAQYKEDDEFDARRVERGERPWARYVRGVVYCIQETGHKPKGAQLMIDSDLPVGAGLSSSAAIEMATFVAFATMGGFDVPPNEAARICQKAEHTFAGVRCGIMDQTICRLGREGHALLLDCESLETVQVPLKASGHVWVLLDTSVRHELGASEYNRRREECESAAKKLVPPGAKQTLRHADPGVFAAVAMRGELTENEIRRVRHVLTEDMRVARMCLALNAGDMAEAGELLNGSHRSLRDDYQVSCPELDVMAEICLTHEPCRGARMVGGGFGGAVLALVKEKSADAFTSDVLEEYRRRTGRTGTGLTLRAAAGARVLA